MTDTLLLIEDEPLLRGELDRHFRREGWSVYSAATLVQARRALVQEDLQPLVVVSDMSLPDGTRWISSKRFEDTAVQGNGCS
jgi:DNA-binding response OmpR family regulator